MPTRTVALVPLRSGSTRVPGKNTRLLRGRPLAAWMMRALEAATRVDEVHLSTSSDEIEAALRGQCEFGRVRRPEALSRDTACAPEIFTHAAEELGLADEDIVLRVDATYPFVRPEWIDACVERLLSVRGAECVFLGRPAERPEFSYHAPDPARPFLAPFHVPRAVAQGLDWSEYVQARFEPAELVYGPCGLEVYRCRTLRAWRNPWMRVPSLAVSIPPLHAVGVDTPDDWELVEVIAEHLARAGKLPDEPAGSSR